MNILDRFESSFERLIEGSIGRIFRSPIQPAEIGRKLERAMTAHQVISMGSTLVPNDYRVAMHPDDLLQFVDYVSSLNRHMETWLSELAAERGFTLVDRTRVQIVGDSKVPRRAITVIAAIADRPDINQSEQDVLQRTEVYRVVRASTGTSPLRLRFLSGPQNGQDLILRKPVMTLGRALDNDIVLEAGDVSRHHARLEYADGKARLSDLGSTNGTKVNGSVIKSQTVVPGDELSFGTLRMRLLALDVGR